jgi:hypothetical protein
MAHPKLEVADGQAYRQQHDGSLSTAERRVMTAIEVCRTAALGGLHCVVRVPVPKFPSFRLRDAIRS